MKPLSGLLFRVLPAMLVASGVIQAQTVAPAPPGAGTAAARDDEPPIVLSVFEVNSARA